MDSCSVCEQTHDGKHCKEHRTFPGLNSGISLASRHYLAFPWPKIPIERVYEAKGRLSSPGEDNRKNILCVFERMIALHKDIPSLQTNHNVAQRKIEMEPKY